MQIGTKVIRQERQRQHAKTEPFIRIRPASHGAYRSDSLHYERFLVAREMLGLTQEEFAVRLNVPVELYEVWEDGTVEPTREDVEHMALVTGIFRPGWFYMPLPEIAFTSLEWHCNEYEH